MARAVVDFKALEIWFVTGSQHLYGEETLQMVAAHSQEMARGLADLPKTPIQVVFQPVLTTPESILELCQAANRAKNCIGLITWMHTFSPAKMWIGGLKALEKPFVHLHTQYNRELPWSDDRHGLHESEPGGAWRPRVRIHRHANGVESQSHRWLLAGRGRPGGAGDLGARRVCLARCAEHESGAFRR